MQMFQFRHILRLAVLLVVALLPVVAYSAEGTLSASNYEYAGGVRKGKQHGYGVCRYKNGNVYYGYWDMGYKHGLGRLVYADGSIDFGTWKRGKLAKPKGKKFKVGKRCYGIDVAKYQKKIDWTKLQLYADANGIVRTRKSKTARFSQPVLFALIKSTEGTTIVDPYFKRNFRQAKRCGIIRGAYHFLSVNSPVEEQVAYFIANTPLEPGDLPPVLDLEINKKVMARNHKKVVAMAKQWLEAVEKHYGVKPIIYTYNNYYRDYLKGHGFDDYDFWIARYGDEPSVKGWDIWQLTDKARVPGIGHAVDVDLFRGTYTDLLRYVEERPINVNPQ